MTLKQILTLVGAALIAAAIGGRACYSVESARYQRMLGEYQQKVKDADAAMQASLATITAQATQITALKADVAAAEKQRDALAGDIARINANLTDARAKVAALEALPATVENLTAANAALHDEVTLLETAVGKERDDKAGVVIERDKWKAAYDSAVAISAQWNDAYVREHALRLAAESLAKASQSRVAYLQVTGIAKDVIIIAAGGYIGYRLITGK